jgi:hypothetical protein
LFPRGPEHFRERSFFAEDAVVFAVYGDKDCGAQGVSEVGPVVVEYLEIDTGLRRRRKRKKVIVVRID